MQNEGAHGVRKGAMLINLVEKVHQNFVHDVKKASPKHETGVSENLI